MSPRHAKDGVFIGWVEKSQAELIGVFLKDHEGFRYVDVRIYGRSINKRPTPTKKGIALRPARLPELVKLLEAAHAMIEANGALIEPRNGHRETKR